ncbi:Rieske (2Fe-2S) protein [Rhodopila sp.]|uniref:Rieske (2Fe-2S) protein n=1 Tax=Rhodopila sp. TaxID=2480087 RepID=UPI003D0A09AC
MIALCAAAEVTPGRPVLARLTPTFSVILLRLTDGALVAWRNACPHMGIELDWEPNRLLTRGGRYLKWTGHGALFNPDTGLCVRGPCAGEALTALPVRVQDDKVVIDQAP